MSGTGQAAVTFPAKGEEGGRGGEASQGSLGEEGTAYKTRDPESDRDQRREIIRPRSPVSAFVSAGEGFAHSPGRKSLAKGRGRPGQARAPEFPSLRETEKAGKVQKGPGWGDKLRESQV